MEQKSPEWFAARLGKVTASRIADIMATTKSGPAASRENYAVELALQRLTGVLEESYINKDMQWGIDKEPEARAAYESAEGLFVTEVGLIEHPTIPMAAASPDGLVGDSGLIEIKCPKSATHLATLHSGKPDMKYVYQMQWQMACTGREWCDFVSYDPRFPELHRLFIVRIVRDQKMIGELESQVVKFQQEVEAIVKDLE